MGAADLSNSHGTLDTRPVVAPSDDRDGKIILSFTKSRNETVDTDVGGGQLCTASSFQNAIVRTTNNSQEDIIGQPRAQVSKCPFQAFFDFIKRVDDAEYSKSTQRPAIDIALSRTEFVVELNDDTFSLPDILSICDARESSKLSSYGSVGKENSDLKPLLVGADSVHVQSSRHSFRLYYLCDATSLLMSSPAENQRENATKKVNTTLKVKFSGAGLRDLMTLYACLRTLHPSFMLAVRKLMNVSIRFNDTEPIRFERSFNENTCLTKIFCSGPNKVFEYTYWVFATEIVEPAKLYDHTGSRTAIQIGLPVAANRSCVLDIPFGSYCIFAHMPIMRFLRLPFWIDADFRLASDQSTIIDDAWNRRLQDGIACLFVNAVRKMTVESCRIAFDWLAYISAYPTAGFFAQLQHQIVTNLSREKLFHSISNDLREVSMLRSVPASFMHDGKPLLSNMKQKWQFLSLEYSNLHDSVIALLGIRPPTTDEFLKLIDDDLSSIHSKCKGIPLRDSWHNSFLSFVQGGLQLHDEKYLLRVGEMRVVPVCEQNKQEWRRPGAGVYFPTLVNEGSGLQRIKFDVPKDLSITVLHPDAATNPCRLASYKLLGVRCCPPQLIVDRIQLIHGMLQNRERGAWIADLELLFWHSSHYSPDFQKPLYALSKGEGVTRIRELFMRSTNQNDAGLLIELENNPQYKDHFLSDEYQKASVSTASRNGRTWEEWLYEVAGVRRFAPLQDFGDQNKLHWMISVVREKYPAKFVPLLQQHWSTEYHDTCESNNNIKQALRDSKVLCRHGGFKELSRTWFPSPLICDIAERFGAENLVPILALPECNEAQQQSQWPCLAYLGVQSQPALFYILTLVYLSETWNTPKIGVNGMEQLYESISNQTRYSKAKLQHFFRDRAIIWNPCKQQWHTTADCVWTSPIPLKSKFVVASVYSEISCSNLFHNFLDIGISLFSLVDELRHIRDLSLSDSTKCWRENLSTLYTAIRDMIKTAEDEKMLRFAFEDESLVYAGDADKWITPSSCLWHDHVAIDDLEPIAELYPGLKNFFVDSLHVKIITDTYLMERLTEVTNKVQKNASDMRKTMLLITPLLSANVSKLECCKSIEALRKRKFLPCATPLGNIEFCSPEDEFFIADSNYLAAVFKGKLKILDFTYEEVVSLHKLLQILGLNARYLTQQVRYETTAGSAESDDDLTAHFQDRAYAISCCAVAHRSTKYLDQATALHEKLQRAVVQTSSNVITKLVVFQDGLRVEVEDVRPSMIFEEDETDITITLPRDLDESVHCVRSKLPGLLAECLQISGPSVERQLYRILNETDTEIEDILLTEDISQVSWLACRIPSGLLLPPEFKLGWESASEEDDDDGCVTKIVLTLVEIDRKLQEMEQATLSTCAERSIVTKDSTDVVLPLRAKLTILNH